MKGVETNQTTEDRIRIKENLFDYDFGVDRSLLESLRIAKTTCALSLGVAIVHLWKF